MAGGAHETVGEKPHLVHRRGWNEKRSKGLAQELAIEFDLLLYDKLVLARTPYASEPAEPAGPQPSMHAPV